MIYYLLRVMHNLFPIKVPAVFLYSSTRMILAAITSTLLTIFLGPFLIKKLYELRIGEKIRSKEECPLLAKLHGKKKDTPTMGGLLILSAMLFSLFLFMDFSSSFTWILAVTTLILGGLGAVDDYLKLKRGKNKGVSPKKKMVIQGFFALLLALYLFYPSFAEGLLGIKAPIARDIQGTLLSSHEYMSTFFIPFVKEPFHHLPLVFIFILIFFVICGSSNAVNLTDGLDGLAAGCLAMVASSFGLIAFLSNHLEIAKYLNIYYIEGSSEIGIYLFALAGATLGFLWYNGYPAQIFMGDTGSLALGGVIGVSAVLLRRELLLAIIGGIFVMEALSVILQVASYRLRKKKRIFLCAPLHHHFEYKGWPESKVVIRFWIISLFLALIGIASLKFQ